MHRVYIPWRKSRSSTFSGELGRREAGGGDEEGDELAQSQNNERLLGPEAFQKRHFFCFAELGCSPWCLLGNLLTPAHPSLYSTGHPGKVRRQTFQGMHLYV